MVTSREVGRKVAGLRDQCMELREGEVKQKCTTIVGNLQGAIKKIEASEARTNKNIKSIGEKIKDLKRKKIKLQAKLGFVAKHKKKKRFDKVQADIQKVNGQIAQLEKNLESKKAKMACPQKEVKTAYAFVNTSAMEFEQGMNKLKLDDRCGADALFESSRRLSDNANHWVGLLKGYLNGTGKCTPDQFLVNLSPAKVENGGLTIGQRIDNLKGYLGIGVGGAEDGALIESSPPQAQYFNFSEETIEYKKIIVEAPLTGMAGDPESGFRGVIALVTFDDFDGEYAIFGNNASENSKIVPFTFYRLTGGFEDMSGLAEIIVPQISFDDFVIKYPEQAGMARQETYSGRSVPELQKLAGGEM